jgi:O-antigen ligase
LDQRITIFLVLFGVTLLLSALFPAAPRHARHSGFFLTATHLGQISALTALCAFSEWLMGRRQVLWSVLLAGSMVAMLLSRTRASLGAMLLGCGVILLLYTLSPTATHRLRAGMVLFGLFIATVAFFFLFDYGLVQIQSALKFLRLSGGIPGVLAGRVQIWAAGFEKLKTAGWLGGGFSEKWGGIPQEVWGIEYPRYSWEVIADPHNMLMTTAAQLGIPAMLVLAFVVIAVGVSLQRLPTRARALGSGFYAAGLVFGLLDGNWFITLGPPDRMSLTMIALLLGSAAVSEPAENEDEPGSVGRAADRRGAGEADPR